MKISELIDKLRVYEAKYGDMRVSTWDGFIVEVHATPCHDGVQGRRDRRPNELSLDIRCE